MSTIKMTPKELSTPKPNFARNDKMHRSCGRKLDLLNHSQMSKMEQTSSSTSHCPWVGSCIWRTVWFPKPSADEPHMAGEYASERSTGYHAPGETWSVPRHSFGLCKAQKKTASKASAAEMQQRIDSSLPRASILTCSVFWKTSMKVSAFASGDLIFVGGLLCRQNVFRNERQRFIGDPLLLRDLMKLYSHEFSF